MSDNIAASTHPRSYVDNVHAHYDLSNEFFALFQDPTVRTPSSGAMAPEPKEWS
jgi:cyclopropane fatty-acyl-phospholipid synthase-like methyltransferase